MEQLFDEIFSNRNLHQDKNIDIPEIYKKYSLHIALENADTNQDWDTFKKLYNLSPSYLKEYLKMTNSVFEYNYKKLSFDEQIELFN
jgi:hypothetical protein